MRYVFGFICVLALVGGDCGDAEEFSPGIECSSVGDKVCSRYAPFYSTLILVCSTSTYDGTPRYIVDTDCGDFDMECSNFVGDPMCRCEPEGSSRCFDKYLVQVCDADGAWTDSETCDEGTECALQDQVAVCALAGPCTDGTTRCSSDRSEVETCQSGDWNVTATCEQDQLCNDLGETAQCVDAACTEGETRCADNEVETCNALGLWTMTDTCVQGCEVVNDEARCIVDETQCTANNLFDQRCNPSNEVWIQECQNTGTEQAPVYEWVDSQNCSLQSPDYICIQEMGTFPYCFL